MQGKEKMVKNQRGMNGKEENKMNWSCVKQAAGQYCSLAKPSGLITSV